MNCQQCNCPNEHNARFCKNCGTLLNYNLQPSNPYLNTNANYSSSELVPAVEPTLKYFYILCSYDLFRTFMWLILTKVVTPALTETSGSFSKRLSLMYDIYGWLFDLILWILVISFAVVVKNRSAKTFIIIYGIISFLLFLGFRFWE
jgi:hypothetical protein